MTAQRVLLMAAGLGLSACSRPPTVTIATPTEGETVSGPAVQVTLGVVNVEIAPVAENRPGAAHSHLFLDVDVTPLDAPVPVGVAGVVHLGGGQLEYRFDSLAAGPHRLIAVLGDNTHVPLSHARADTVNFVVGPWP